MNDPLFNFTGADNFPQHLKAVITGPPKSGKTTFLGTVPGIVILDTEPDSENLASVAHLNLPYVTIRSMSDLQKIRFVLTNPQLREQAGAALNLPNGIEAVSIDTMDTLQAIMKRERMESQRTTQFLRDDWSWIKEEMTKLIEAFTALPMHVFFTVHTKTKDLGKGDEIRTIVLPGLEGSIADDIAGMVGYSLLSFRKQEFKEDGTPFTRYFMRCEGDETYEFLGNRAAGRLPDVIDPDFKVLYAAAYANPVTSQQQAVQWQPQQPQQPQAEQPTQAQEPAAQQPRAQQPTGQPQGVPDGSEPVNAAALTHVAKVYEAVGLTFPEEIIKARTMEEARSIVKMWKAAQADQAEGKGQAGVTAVDEMRTYLTDMGWVGDQSPAEQAAPEVEAKRDGTIKEIQAYVGTDPAKAQEVYDLESAKDQPRTSLLTTLEKIGAKPSVPTGVQSAPAQQEQQAQQQAQPVSSAPNTADDQTMQNAVQTVADGTGPVTVLEDQRTVCAKCGNPLDDPDIADLAIKRYGEPYCVNDYIAAGK